MNPVALYVRERPYQVVKHRVRKHIPSTIRLGIRIAVENAVYESVRAYLHTNSIRIKSLYNVGDENCNKQYLR